MDDAATADLVVVDCPDYEEIVNRVLCLVVDVAFVVVVGCLECSSVHQDTYELA